MIRLIGLNMREDEHPTPDQPRSSMDDVIDVYMKDVDITLLRENLKLTPDERFRKFDQFMKMVDGLREAGQKHRGEE